MKKRILSVLVSIIVFAAVVALVEGLFHKIYPVPDSLDKSKPETIRVYMETAPQAALMGIVLAWLLATLAGCISLSLILKNQSRSAYLVFGAVVLFFTLINLVTIPHPIWINISGPVGIAIICFVFYKLSNQ